MNVQMAPTRSPKHFQQKTQQPSAGTEPVP